MKEYKRFLSTIRNSLLTVLFLSLLTSSVVNARPSWAKLGTGDFPARVKSVVWPSGNALDATSGVCWGKWCANFGEQAPVARCNTSYEIAYNACAIITIGNALPKGMELKCYNEVVGERDCMIWFILHPVFECSVQGDGISQFPIKCPATLRFE